MSTLLGCPKCVGKLEPKKIGSVEVDVCFVCGGIWFDEGELKKAIEAKSRLFSVLKDVKEVSRFEENQAAHFDDKEGSLCPRCDDGTKFEKRRQGSMHVDYCPKGHGVWLDTGEFENMVMDRLKLRYGLFWGFAFAFLIIGTGGLILLTLGRRSRRYPHSGGRSGGAGATESW